ncbi:MAG: DUF192 domain-containing protein [Candidatus Paceibacterota bacterium]|jgi:hypothetical protein
MRNLIPKWLGLIIFLITLLYLISFFYQPQPREKVLPETITEVVAVSIGDVVINTFISETREERSRGLSGRKALLPNEGMLFVFEKPDLYGFWMKDMNFGIDIIWIDENKKIIYMEENILPESFPIIFQPILPALYVLEVPSGFVFTNKIKIGDSVIF